MWSAVIWMPVLLVCFYFSVTERDYVLRIYFDKWFILQQGHSMTKADEFLYTERF